MYNRVPPPMEFWRPATFWWRSTANPFRNSSRWKKCWTIMWGRVKVEVQRGSQSLQHDLDVQSLSAITPDEFIEFGEAVVHTLSYQQARHFNVPVKGVYIANPGYVFGAAGIPRAALIASFNGKKVESLADFAAALAELADGARAPVRYVTIEDPRAVQLKVI